jgi:hypothetical protein
VIFKAIIVPIIFWMFPKEKPIRIVEVPAWPVLKVCIAMKIRIANLAWLAAMVSVAVRPIAKEDSAARMDAGQPVVYATVVRDR